MVWHVLAADCNCSQRILRYLRQQSALEGFREKLFWITDDNAASPELPDEPTLAGRTVTRLSREQLAQRYHLEAAPVMLVTDPAGTIRYLGGYTERKQGAAIRRNEIAHAVRQGTATRPLPLFGCAMSNRLRRLQNPLARRDL